jgi:hypothetical protein
MLKMLPSADRGFSRILVPNLLAGYRPAVLNAPIKKSQGFKSGDLGGTFGSTK